MNYRLSCVALLAAIALFGRLDADIVADGALVSLIHDVQIPAQERGVLDELLAREGMKVQAGELLARIDQSIVGLQGEVATLHSKIAQLESENDVNLRFAKKSDQVSRAEVQRYEEAVCAYPKAISKSELDEARFTAERGMMSIEQAEIELEAAELTSKLRQKENQIAEKRVDNSQIKSPISGIIVETLVQQGEWAEIGQPIVRVIGLDRLRVEAFLRPEDCDDATVGKTVRFEVAVRNVAGRLYEGEVVFVSPEINPVTGQVHIWAEVENNDGLLRPGTQGRLRVAE